MTGPTALPDPPATHVRHYVEVVNLNVRCAFPMRADVRAASDTCQQPATSAVRVPPNGVAYYRCNDHAGMVDGFNRAPIMARVVRRRL